jgi:hypothetical protein
MAPPHGQPPDPPQASDPPPPDGGSTNEDSHFLQTGTNDDESRELLERHAQQDEAYGGNGGDSDDEDKLDSARKDVTMDRLRLVVDCDDDRHLVDDDESNAAVVLSAASARGAAILLMIGRRRNPPENPASQTSKMSTIRENGRIIPSVPCFTRRRRSTRSTHFQLVPRLYLRLTGGARLVDGISITLAGRKKRQTRMLSPCGVLLPHFVLGRRKETCFRTRGKGSLTRSC